MTVPRPKYPVSGRERQSPDSQQPRKKTQSRGIGRRLRRDERKLQRTPTEMVQGITDSGYPLTPEEYQRLRNGKDRPNDPKGFAEAYAKATGITPHNNRNPRWNKFIKNLADTILRDKFPGTDGDKFRYTIYKEMARRARGGTESPDE